MNIKRNVIFQLESRKKAGVPIVENVPIRMRVIFNNRRIEFTTGYRIDASKWDVDRQRVKNGCTNKLKQSASQINADLNHFDAVIQNIFKEYELKGEMPTMQQVKDAFNEQVKIKTPVPAEEQISEEARFWDVYDTFIKETGRLKSWTKASYQKFAAVRKHLLDFDKNVNFSTFDESGLNRYMNYLQTELSMLNSTVDNQIAFVKWFLRWSYEKGYHDNAGYITFRPKLKDTQKKVIFLTDAELDAIKNYTIPPTKQYLERVRDVLIFCCYSGLRHSDVYNLKKSDIKDDHIEVTTVKTADSLIIELNNHSRAIWNKYKDVAFPDNKALPVISNQKMNDYIKELGELAGIDTSVRITQYRGNEREDVVLPKYQLLSTHTGRKTFICKALALGIPVQIVMKWTGHSDYKTMKPYIDVADEIRASAMNKFNE